MVKIESSEEFLRITESNFGFVVSVKPNQKAIMHKTDCDYIKKIDFATTKEEEFHWFSSFSFAGKEFENINSCKICNP